MKKLNHTGNKIYFSDPGFSAYAIFCTRSGPIIPQPTIRKDVIVLFFAILILTVFPGNLSAQDYKYKDIYPLIEEGRSEEAFPLLKKILKEEPDNPSANMQLAMIYEKRFLNCQPILQFHRAMENAEEAKIYYLKASLLVDEREIKKNGKKFYTNLATFDDKGRPDVEFYRVRKKIDSAYIEIDNFIRNIPIIFNMYSRAARTYDRSVKLYTGINENYKSRNEIYMLYNASLKTSLEDLKTAYDSSIMLFKNYLNATENYPVTDYKQQYEIKEIKNYRIDGMQTNSNLLAGEVIFWDYGSWVDTIFAEIENPVAEFRKQIIENEDKLDNNLEKLKNPEDQSASSVVLVHPDRDLILKIRSYDPQSIIIPLLNYKDKKQELLFKASQIYRSSMDTAFHVDHEALLCCYSMMIRQALNCDSVLRAAERLVAGDNLKKYENLIDKFYYGITGINKYFQNEHQFLKEQIQDYSHKIKLGLVNHSGILSPDSLKPLVYDKKPVSLSVQKPGSLDIPRDSYITSRLVSSPDTSIFIGGIVRPKSKTDQISVFLARAAKGQSVEWLKTFALTPEMLDSASMNALKSGKKSLNVNLVNAMTLTDKGCAMLISAADTSAHRIYNVLKIIDWEGEEVFSGFLNMDLMPRFLSYNESKNSLVIVAKGQDRSNNAVDREKVIVTEVGPGGAFLWNSEFNITGNIAGIVDIDDGYLLAGNYSTIEFAGDKTVTAGKESETETFIFKFDSNGKIRDEFYLKSTSPFYLQKLAKVNDQAISLLGYPADIHELSEFPGSEDMVNILTDSDLNVVNSEINMAGE